MMHDLGLKCHWLFPMTQCVSCWRCFSIDVQEPPFAQFYLKTVTPHRQSGWLDGTHDCKWNPILLKQHLNTNISCDICQNKSSFPSKRKCGKIIQQMPFVIDHSVIFTCLLCEQMTIPSHYLMRFSDGYYLFPQRRCSDHFFHGVKIQQFGTSVIQSESSYFTYLLTIAHFIRIILGTSRNKSSDRYTISFIFQITEIITCNDR